MAPETALPVEERLCRLLQHLGVGQAHFAGRVADDWAGLVTRFPEIVVSMTAIGLFDPRTVEHLGAPLLAVNGDHGRTTEAMRPALLRLPGAQALWLHDFDLFAWSDIAAERNEELGSAMLQFLERATPPARPQTGSPREGEGEFAGISYRIRGAGPPLVLLPMFLAASQWEPLISRLAQQYCTITLGGAALGAVAVLESRGHAAAYLQMVRSLIDEAQPRQGEAILEVGCGTGVLLRWLAGHTRAANRITGLDINHYMLQEAAALARRDGLADAIDLQEGNAETLPFPDASFDVVMSVTVIEEVDADRMLAEMVRVTKPGGRVALACRAIDIPYLANLPLSGALKAKVEAARGGVAPRGCADASLYRRMRQAGLRQLTMLPQLTAFDQGDGPVVEQLLSQLLTNPSDDEAREWQAARAQAEAEGTFFIAWPHHAAVGIKPG